jgi:hypothetical protein
MLRLIRFVVCCLVALAVPVQGVAALHVMACAPDIDRASARASMHESKHGSMHGSMHGSTHDTSGTPGASPSPTPQPSFAHWEGHPCHEHTVDGAADAAQAHADNVGCGACSFCGCVAALPATTPVVPGDVAPATHDAHVVPSRCSFITSAPERPPRAIGRC